MSDSQSIRDLDLNLLKTLAALLQERSVTSAAAQLGMTPSGVSRALARLRRYFGDDLLVREGRGMAPTPVALALGPAVDRVLDDVARLRQAGSFDPATDRWTVRLTGADYLEHALLPRLAAHLACVAPGVAVHLVKRSRVVDDLRHGHADLAVDMWASVDAPDLVVSRLLSDRLVCVVRRDHPSSSGELTVEAYAAASHVLVAPHGRPGGLIDGILADRGLSRRVAVMTSTFAAALPVVAVTDHVTALPLRMVQALAERWPVTVRELPFEVPPFTLGAFWPARLHTSPAHRWFRAMLFELARGEPIG
ncbi:MAG: LysR family transcriptional regulator [Myxococcales bacterium]|nr:LysR family transcriptional regulator [Myxococcales bacterium]